MLSVGLIGATGYMGQPFYRALLEASRQSKLRFVLLHRPSTDLSKFPEDLEKRVVDLEKPDQRELEGAVHDLDIVVSAISHRAFDAQIPLIEALATSPRLITFFPSEYATPIRDEDINKSPHLTGRTAKAQIVEKAKELGVPVTVVANATTPEILFGWPGISSFLPKENRLELYEPQGNGTRGLTSKEFSGQALLHLILNRTTSLPNNNYSIVELQYSSCDLISTFTKVNGKPPIIDTYTEDDYLRDLQKSGFGGAMKAARMKGLAEGCIWPGDIIGGKDLPGWEERGLEGYVRDYL